MGDKPNYYAIIPANVRYDNRLPAKAILLYGEITSLTHTNGYCWATDSHFAKLYEVSNTTIQNWLGSLEKYGYISRKRIYKEGTKQIQGRYIKIFEYPTQENLGTYPNKFKDPTQKNLRDNIKPNIKSNNKSNNKPSKPPQPVADRDHFESLWKLYPNKKGKESAWNSYKRSIKDGVSDDEIKQGINNYLAEIKAKQTPKRYIKHGQTWFRDKGWEDDYDTEPDDPQPSGRNKVIQRETLPEWARDDYQPPESKTLTAEEEKEMNERIAKVLGK